MTIGYYAIRPPVPGHRTTAPWPYCRTCAQAPGMRRVVAIDERAHPSLTCRGCKVRLRDWR